jgi:hypothetical protein
MNNCPSRDWDRYDTMQCAQMDAEMSEPVYTIYRAFASLPLCETIGVTGLMRTMAQLAPDLYQILEEGLVVANGERREDGTWQVEFTSGVILAPGCVVV